MKVIVAGSRTFDDYRLLCRTLDSINDTTPITEVICGGAKGADTLGRQWADRNRIIVTPMDAEWNRYGKSAGMIRNKQMGDYADYLVAFWDGKSPGTKHMIEYMKSLGKHGIVIYFE